MALLNREEQQLRAQVKRLLKLYRQAEPSIQRGMIAQVNELCLNVQRLTGLERPKAPRYAIVRGEVFDTQEQKFIPSEEIDPETILPSIY